VSSSSHAIQPAIVAQVVAAEQKLQWVEIEEAQ